MLARAQAFPGGVLCLLEGVEGSSRLVQVLVGDDVEVEAGLVSRSLLFLLRLLLSALGARRPALLRALCLLLCPEGLAGSFGHGVSRDREVCGVCVEELPAVIGVELEGLFG